MADVSFVLPSWSTSSFVPLVSSPSLHSPHKISPPIVSCIRCQATDCRSAHACSCIQESIADCFTPIYIAPEIDSSVEQLPRCLKLALPITSSTSVRLSLLCCCVIFPVLFYYSLLLVSLMVGVCWQHSCLLDIYLTNTYLLIHSIVLWSPLCVWLSTVSVFACLSLSVGRSSFRPSADYVSVCMSVCHLLPPLLSNTGPLIISVGCSCLMAFIVFHSSIL